MASERAGEWFTERAFFGATKGHVQNPADPAFSFCGTWRAGQTLISAVEVAEVDRCAGRCRPYWPAVSGSAASDESSGPETT